jgi:hypothetical protein
MPNNDLYQRLHDAYLLMLNDSEYLFHYQRIGASSMEDSWVDPATQPDPLDILVSFRTSVANGVFPDPKTLIYVANCFATYLEAKGELTLDEAFKLVPKQKSGHPLKRAGKWEKVDEFLSRMASYRAENPKATIIDAASALCPASENDRENFVELMAYYYKTRGWSMLEKQMEGGRIRLEPSPPEG